MKIFSRILALVMAFCIISSCSILKGTSGNGLSNGLQTGLALLNMYNTIKQNKQVQQAQTQAAQQQATATATRGLDLSNASNLLNIAQILTGAGTLQNATPTYTNQFSNGLIEGSSNLVNQSNVSNVLGSLLNLNNIDTSSILNAAVSAAATQAGNAATKATQTATQAATQAATSAAQQAVTVTQQTPGVSETLGVLGSLFNIFGK